MATLINTGSLQSLRYSNDDNLTPKLSVLDQSLLPKKVEYIEIPDVESAWGVIRSMQIRGASLIALVACLGLGVDLATNPKTISNLNKLPLDDANALVQYISQKIDYLRTSRPTAVNIFNALDELTSKIKNIEAENNADEPSIAEEEGKILSVQEKIVQCVITHAEYMLERDISDNESIASHGANVLLSHLEGRNDDDRNNLEEDNDDENDGLKILTMCNTGNLGTAGCGGTALGVVREIHRRSMLKSITVLETRPYNQGARLTAYEIVKEKMPGGQLICDSMAASLMKRKGVDAVIVGADRVCMNGDTASKIGTYNLAIVAAAHNVPFYVASPSTTLDTKAFSGDDIEIEERPAQEMIRASGAPDEIGCWNPGFDITPASYITGIITEKGVIEKSADGTFDVISLINQNDLGTSSSGEIVESTNRSGMMRQRYNSGIVLPDYYTEQTIESLPLYIAKNAPDAMKAMEATSFVDLDCEEIGDSNLNLVFIITNIENDKKVIVKQALPYARFAGESWPLSVNRSFYEFKALSIEKEACPQFVPTIYYFSKPNGLIVMEYIPHPTVKLRKGLIARTRYTTMAADMGVFVANTLFKTSGFKLSSTELRKEVEFWSKNSEMCALTEQVVFTEPYIKASSNHWTSPHLDADKEAIEDDTQLKLAAAKLKSKFVTKTEALLHADLNSDSIMCSSEPGQTFVIDPKFGFYGPMGFDTGAFIANLLLSYVSQEGHNNGSAYADWVLDQVVIFWDTFRSDFIKLWNDPVEHTGDYFQRSLFGDETALKLVQDDFMEHLLHDTFGFAGMKMLRRIVGTVHVEDLDSIDNKDIRAKCERHGLEIAKELIKQAKSYPTIISIVEMAREKKSKG